MTMEKDLGYQELLVLAQRLEARANDYATQADASQAEGMASYVASQENALEQARFAYETNYNEFLEVAKAYVAQADHNAVLRLLRAYGEFGVKEN